jgi:hypothetical protein
MLLVEALKMFGGDCRGSRRRLAEALGVSVGAISQWGDSLPEGQAYKLQVITHNQIKVNPTFYKKPRASNDALQHEQQETDTQTSAAIPHRSQGGGGC